MAALATIVDNFLTDDNEDSDDDLSFLISVCTCRFRRTNVPKVTGFAERIVELYSDTDFCHDFRIYKATYMKLMDELRDTLTYGPRLAGKPPLPAEKQVLIYLWYISNQDSIREISRLFGVSKSTTHRCVRRVSATISELRSKLIKWPDNEEQREISTSIEEGSHIKDCIGFIDGTHIKLSSVPNGDQDFVCRKGFPSIQLQLIVDDRLVIRDSYVGWPGCAHDARVFRNSPIYTALTQETNILPNKYIIGDSAYPLSSTVITPFRDNGRMTREQRYYNRTVSSVRQTVERTIGHLKGRFRRLRDVDCACVRDTCYLTTSTCVLYNLCVLSEDDIADYIDMQTVNNAHPNNYPALYHNANAGVRRRENIVQHLQQFMNGE